MDTYRARSNRRPEAAKVRADMAGLYRKLRKDNPAMARLLFRRQKDCLKTATARILELSFAA